MDTTSVRRFRGAVLMVALLLSLARTVVAAPDNDAGPIVTAGFSGSSFDTAWIFKLDGAAGYRVNRHFDIAAGLPFYFVYMPSDDSEGGGSRNGIGNAYIDLRVMHSGSIHHFSSSVRGTAPTGNMDDGFSTGRVTVDWSNYLVLNLGRWAPFASAGLANTVADTRFFTRPFTSLGLVGQVEGGIVVYPVDWAGIGGSAYAVLPRGEQKLYSRVVRRQGGNAVDDAGSGRGRNRTFETESLTTGESDIAKDHGFSTWVEMYPSSWMLFEIGYNRSVSYEANTLFFSVRFDVLEMRGKSGRR